ncbi:MAG: rod shape-determining protein MreD [Actinobacteria bacterium]|nr:rod shape-determining protein MreD [Actinomycetota bacterium]
MIWKRALLVTLLTITGLALETSVVGRVTLLGARPELLVVVLVALAMNEGPELGAVAGFVMGFATDLVLQGPTGSYTLTFVLLGYAVGAIREQLQTPSAWLPMSMVLFSTLGAVLFYGAFTAILGDGVTIGGLLRAAGLASLYNALLTPFVFPVVRALASRLRPAGVTA